MAFLGTKTETFSTTRGSAVKKAREYAGRRNDREQVKDAFIAIYGTELKTEVDPESGDHIQAFKNARFGAKIENDMVEALSIGWGHKVAEARASLFTEPGNKFGLNHETKDKDVKPAEELLELNRNEGGFKSAMVDADRLSGWTGSGAVYVHANKQSLTYEYYGRDDIRFFPQKSITEDGKPRAVDRNSLDDLHHIIICLGKGDEHGQWEYLAMFRRGKDYPLGRWVVYQTGDTVEVPGYGSKEIIEEYVMDRDSEESVRCNPLSWYADQNPDLTVPEYPLSIINGGLTDSKQIMPVTTSLHTGCLEFSRAASHTLSKSQIAATGTIALTRKTKSEGLDVPETLYGQVALAAGDELQGVPHDSASIEVAYKLIREMMVDQAMGFGVADFYVISEDHTVDASSGIALKVKARPQTKVRNDRIDKNSKPVRRIFQVEQAYISMFAPSDTDQGAIALLVECAQQWDAGELHMPENKKETAERIVILIDKGIMDTIDGIREYNQYPTDVEAMEHYLKMQDRAAKFPPLNQPEEPAKEQTFGLKRKRKVPA